MQNQRLPKIDMAKSGNKRSRFNFSHDVNTTADFGVCQPAMCKLIVPGSKTTLSTESLTRLSPMVAPTFGRLKYKLWHQFVEIDDICEQFNALMAQEPIYSAVDAVTAVPTQVPSIPLSCLTSLCFVGARATFYKVTSGSGVWDYQYEAFRSNVSGDMSELLNLVTSYKESSSSVYLASPVSNLSYDEFSSNASNHIVLNLASGLTSGGTLGRRGICSNWSTTNLGSSTMPTFAAPLQNVYGNNSPVWFDLGWEVNSNGDVVNTPVMPESADFLYEFEAYDGSNTKTYIIAFKFSDVGKRMRKNIIGLGYQLDLESQSEVSFLPLLAYYKAYWNLFGLTQWQDWQQTNAYKLIHLLNSFYNIHLGSVTDPTLASNTSAHFFKIFVGFIKDLMDVFVTDSADYVSSHLPSPAVSPSVAPAFFDVGVTSVSTPNSSGSVDGIPVSPFTNHAFMNSIVHGHADEEFLKRLYKWTNRNTIIGRRIADLLRAQGLGKFVDECKSDFIGYTEDVITISDVVSTADTSFQAGSGATLGEFGGKGVQYTKGKNFTFENDVFGYWVTICAIVPESGYSQQIDPTLYALDKNGFYQPEFDSLGYDASRKNVVQGASDFRHKNPLDSLSATFGYKPRYFEYKFAQNVTNGDMSLRGTRDTYLPYFLDKFIVVNDKYISAKSSNPAQFNVRNLFDASNLPTADERVWRFLTKFPWLGNLRRIFASGGNVDDNLRHRMTDLDYMYWCSSNHDDFLIHNIFDMQCYAPMLAVEDSFETTDEDERANMSVGKA